MPALFAVSCTLFGLSAVRTQAQDVAEAARQERARKQSETQKAKHVYTEQDLSHAQILTPEDRAALQAKKKQAPQPGSPQQETLEAKSNDVIAPVAPVINDQPTDAPIGNTLISDPAAAPQFTFPMEHPQLSLGEVARAYRREKELRHEQEQALEAARKSLDNSTKFHLPYKSDPVLATPVQPVRPAVHLAPIPPAPPNTVASSKRSPFDRFAAMHAVPLQAPVHPHAVAIASNIAATTKQPAHPLFAVHPALPKPARPELVPEFKSENLYPVQPEVLPKPKSVSPIAPVSEKSNLRAIVVQRGDSLWKLAEKELGRGQRWQEFLAVNPAIIRPEYLSAGTTIYVPSYSPALKSPSQAAVESSVTHYIQAKKGDTLSAIALAQLGNANSWACIAQANPAIADPHRIYAGQKLLLPKSCHTR